MKKISRNFHTHTFRCGHALGFEEEYVEAAVNFGIKELGFTDHVFLPGVRSPGMRGNVEELEDYRNAILEAGKRHPEIELHIGFEAEYDPVFYSYYRGLLESGKIDYLIMGQHQFFGPEKIPTWYFKQEDKHFVINHYKTMVIEGMRTGMYSCIAHPDALVHYVKYWDEEVASAMKEIAIEAKKLGIPLEFNMGPSRWGSRNMPGEEVVFTYPFPKFWEIVKEVGNDVIIGADIHEPAELASTDFDWAFEFIDKIGGLHLIDKIKMWKERQKQ